METCAERDGQAASNGKHVRYLTALSVALSDAGAAMQNSQLRRAKEGTCSWPEIGLVIGEIARGEECGMVIPRKPAEAIRTSTTDGNRSACGSQSHSPPILKNSLHAASTRLLTVARSSKES